MRLDAKVISLPLSNIASLALFTTLEMSPAYSRNIAQLATVKWKNEVNEAF